MNKMIDILNYAKGQLYYGLGVALDRAMIKGTVAAESFEGLEQAPAECEVLTGAAGTVAIDDIMDLLNSMHPQLQGGAILVASRSLFNEMAKWKDGNGHYYLTRDVIDGKPNYRILGVAIHVMDNVDAVATGKKAAFLVNIPVAYRGMIKKGMELKHVTADRGNAIAGKQTLVLDMYADARIANPDAIRVLKVQ